MNALVLFAVSCFVTNVVGLNYSFIPQTTNGHYINSPGLTQDVHVFTKDGFHGQNLFMAAALTSSQGGLFDNTCITGFQMRLDDSSSEAPNIGLNFTTWELSFSTQTTYTSVDDMSTVFDDNRNTDFRLVRSGPLYIPAHFYISTNLLDVTVVNDFPATYWEVDRMWCFSTGNFLVEVNQPGYTNGNSSDDFDLDFATSLAPTQFRILTGDFGDATGSFAGGTSTPSQSYQAVILKLESHSCGFTCAPNGTVFCYASDPCSAGTALANFTYADGVGYAEAVNDCLDADLSTTRISCGLTGACSSVYSCESKVFGDPHFVGFDGSRFDFYGEDGKVFNIISDIDFQLNSLFKEMTVKGQDGTWMTEIGLLHNNNSVIFSPFRGVLVNGNVVLRAGEIKRFDDMSIERLAHQVTVVTPGYTVKMEIVGTEDVYINLDISMTQLPVDPHGILGQTARSMLKTFERTNGQKQLDGEESDYVVLDGLLGTDFSFNRFRNVAGIINRPAAKRHVERLDAKAQFAKDI